MTNALAIFDYLNNMIQSNPVGVESVGMAYAKPDGRMLDMSTIAGVIGEELRVTIESKESFFVAILFHSLAPQRCSQWY